MVNLIKSNKNNALKSISSILDTVLDKNDYTLEFQNGLYLLSLNHSMLIKVLKLLKENPLWHTQVQRLTYILGVINNLSGNTDMAIVLPDDSVKARNLLIKHIIEDLIPIVEMVNSCR